MKEAATGSAAGGLTTMAVTAEEKRTIEYMRKLHYGVVTVKVKGGRPVMLTEAMKDVKLTD